MTPTRLAAIFRNILLLGIATGVSYAIVESIKMDGGCGLCGHVGAAILYAVVPGVILAMITFIGVWYTKKYPLYIFLLSGIALTCLCALTVWSYIFDGLREGTTMRALLVTLLLVFLAIFPYTSYRFVLQNKSVK